MNKQSYRFLNHGSKQFTLKRQESKERKWILRQIYVKKNKRLTAKSCLEQTAKWFSNKKIGTHQLNAYVPHNEDQSDSLIVVTVMDTLISFVLA